MPNKLPTSALTMQPRLTDIQMSFTVTQKEPLGVKDENQKLQPDGEGFRPIFRASLAPVSIL